MCVHLGKDWSLYKAQLSLSQGLGGAGSHVPCASWTVAPFRWVDHTLEGVCSIFQQNPSHLPGTTSKTFSSPKLEQGPGSLWDVS